MNTIRFRRDSSQFEKELFRISEKDFLRRISHYRKCGWSILAQGLLVCGCMFFVLSYTLFFYSKGNFVFWMMGFLGFICFCCFLICFFFAYRRFFEANRLKGELEKVREELGRYE